MLLQGLEGANDRRRTLLEDVLSLCGGRGFKGSCRLPLAERGASRCSVDEATVRRSLRLSGVAATFCNMLRRCDGLWSPETAVLAHHPGADGMLDGRNNQVVKGLLEGKSLQAAALGRRSQL